MPTDHGLSEAVEQFVDQVSPALEAIADEVPTVDAGELHNDVLLEAFHLTAGFIDADELRTDDELRAFVDAFGPVYGGHLHRARPSDVRRTGTIRGRRAWLARPSGMFGILAATDARRGTRNTTTYYERALHIARVVASLDSQVSTTELHEIERFRTMLLDAIEEHGAPRPGRPEEPGPEPARSDDASPTPGSEPLGDEPLPPPRPLEELLLELDQLVGLEGVKTEVKLVTNLIQVQNLREERGLPVPESSRHLVFVGNPGTGKTTVARLVAEIYRTLGVVDRGHLVETDRSGLVAGFVGQTATKVVAVFEQADGGVLLIDEAYSLARGSDTDFGREAIDAVVKQMEDRRRSVVVIAAGYPDEMADFLDSNPGLRSRFPKTIEFADYDTADLVRIFELIGEKGRYACTDAARQRVAEWFEGQARSRGFGNGRLARNLFDDAVAHHASRLVRLDDPTDVQLMTLTHEDIPAPGEGPGHDRTLLDPPTGQNA